MKMKMRRIEGAFSIARYAPSTPIGSIFSREFCSVTRTRQELTVVCETDLLPPGMQKQEDGWVCLQVEGLLDFSLTGVLNSITVPLAGAEISIFAVSTFDTDYVLVKKSFFKAAVQALADAGITVS